MKVMTAILSGMHARAHTRLERTSNRVTMTDESEIRTDYIIINCELSETSHLSIKTIKNMRIKTVTPVKEEPRHIFRPFNI